MAEKRASMVVGDGVTVTTVRTDARRARWTFVYAPGAGSNVEDPFGVFAAEELARVGVSTVRFQFPYMEAGRRGPDRPPVLDATWRAVIAMARARPAAVAQAEVKTKLVVGGRSMGGRVASMVVAAGERVDALALFAYPLHPPGKPEASRVEHLSKIRVPALFCSGTRDAFGSPSELRAAAKKVRGSTLHLLEGADHGFAVPKSSGRTRADVWREAVDAMVGWLDAIG